MAANRKEYERKLNNLISCKNSIYKTDTRRATRTEEVRSARKQIIDAMDGFVKSDNIRSNEFIPESLAIKIENHGDFIEAARNLDNAISDVNEKIKTMDTLERTTMAFADFFKR